MIKFGFVMTILAAGVWAQTPPPPPPAPPAGTAVPAVAPPPAPELELRARQLAEEARFKALQDAELAGHAAKLATVEAQMLELEHKLSLPGLEGLGGKLAALPEMERARELAEEARFKLMHDFEMTGQMAKLATEGLHKKLSLEPAPSMEKLASEMAMMYGQTPKPVPAPAPQPGQPPQPPPPPSPWKVSRSSSEESLYRRGTESLDRREWEKAAEYFNQAIEKKGTRAEGAMYWRAYALSKLGKRDESLAGLAALKQSYPSGRWLNDARALELEVQQASGQPVSPDRQSDEDLKLMAINALAGSDPERTVPLLENILKGSNSPKMKERALFVLAQSRTPRGQEVLVNAARGGANPDLQLKAVEYLGVYGGKDNSKALADIYAGTSDVAVKRAVLRGYMISRDKERVLALAKGESNPELRREAVQMLGAMRGQAELWQLYQSETAPENRVHIIQALGISGGGDRVIELARTEKDPKVRRAAIQSIAISRSPQASEALLSIYGSESDKETKKQVVSGLFILRNAKSLVDLARKETDPEMKRDIVEKLSVMKSKEATDYMVELLK